MRTTPVYLHMRQTAPNDVVTMHPESLDGTPVFAGTNVPVIAFFDHLLRGHSPAGFLRRFPSVSRDKVNALLEQVRSRLG